MKDIKAYETYMSTPLHFEIDRAGRPLVSNMISQDLTDDEDTKVGDFVCGSAGFAEAASALLLQAGQPQTQ